MSTMSHPAQEEPSEEELAERFRRWYVCPVVGCGTLEEYDARDQETAHYCPSEQHPATKLRIFFGGRLIRS